jgi:hypothetical protein
MIAAEILTTAPATSECLVRIVLLSTDRALVNLIRCMSESHDAPPKWCKEYTIIKPVYFIKAFFVYQVLLSFLKR